MKIYKTEEILISENGNCYVCHKFLKTDRSAYLSFLLLYSTSDYADKIIGT